MSDGPIGQIFALQPEGVVGGDINPLNMELIRGGGSDSSTFFRDLDYMDMLEAAEDEELFRMLGVNDATPLEQRQQEAAQKYADLVKRQPTTAEDIAAVDAAKAKLVELGVTRKQIEAAGIDPSRGISGVMGPSVSGALEGAIEKGSELFGLGAEGIASLIGADKALSSALLNLPKPGVTFVFGEGGQKRPVITGQTSGGTQVGVTDPYGIFDVLGGVQQGDFNIYDIAGGAAGAAGAVKAATTLADDDPNKKTGVDTGVAITPEGPDAPTDTRIPTITESTSDGTTLPEGVAGPVRVLAADDTVVDAVDVTDRIPTLSLPSDRTTTIEGFDPTATERVPTSITPTEDRTSEDRTPDSPAGGGGGGGGGGAELGETGGVRVVSGGPGPLVDIDYLYDFADSLAQPFIATADENEIEGRQVKRFGDGGIVPGLSNEQLGLLGAAVGGIFGGLGGGGDTQGSQGYTGGIPDLIATREVVPDAFAMEGRRPGEAGRRYFTDVQYTPVTDATGAPTIMGAEQLAAQNAAALARQQELQDLGAGLLGLYGQQGMGGTTTGGTTTDTTTGGTDTATTGTTDRTFTLTAADGTTSTVDLGSDAGTTGFTGTANEDFIYGPAVPTLESLDVDVGDGIDDAERKLVYDLLQRGFTTPTEVASYYDLPLDVVNTAYEELMARGFAQGGEVQDDLPMMYDENSNPATADRNYNYLTTKYRMGPMDPASEEGRREIEKMERKRRRESTRTPIEYLLDMLNTGKEGAELRLGNTSGDRRRFNERNPGFLRQLEDLKEARERILKTQDKGYAQGGLASVAPQGMYLGGPTDGMADQIPATINNMEPARLSDGEFVIPADVVSHLGNGNSDAGAKELYDMMERVRKSRTGNPKQGREIDPKKYLA